MLETYVCRKNYYKNKMKFSSAPSSPVTVFLIDENLLSQWLWNFHALRCSSKIKHNCMSCLFCIATLLEVGRKIHFFNLMDLTPSKPDWSKIFPLQILRQKVLYTNDFETCKKPKRKEK